MKKVPSEQNDIVVENIKEDDIKDIFMQSQVQGAGYETSDQARADAIAKLSDIEPKRLKILSDLSARQIGIISAMDTMDSWLSKNGINSIITKTYTNRIITYSLSYNRKARTEIKDIVKAEPNAQGQLGMLEKFKYRMGI